MGRPSTLSMSRRSELIIVLIRKEAQGSELARRYGVSESTVKRWRDEFLEAGKQSLQSSKGSTEAAKIKKLQSDLAEHKQLIVKYAYASDFLKKTADLVLATLEK